MRSTAHTVTQFGSVETPGEDNLIDDKCRIGGPAGAGMALTRCPRRLVSWIRRSLTPETNTARPSCHDESPGSMKTPAINNSQEAGLTSGFLFSRGTTSSAFSTSPAPFSSASGGGQHGHLASDSGQAAFARLIQVSSAPYSGVRWLRQNVSRTYSTARWSCRTRAGGGGDCGGAVNEGHAASHETHASTQEKPA